MTRGSRAALARLMRDVRDRAAASVASQALRTMTTPAIERATLRLFGIGGLDASGRPLAASVVERAAEAAGGLGAGVALPLAAAAVTRDLGAHQAALGVADGEIDFAVEAAFLQHPDRRNAAERLLADWTTEAFERMDANRTARRELVDSLGASGRPWLGARVGSVALDAASSEVRAFVAAGAQALIVRVPPTRELALARGETADGLPENMEPPPTGSQRGLAALRSFLDELAAEGGRYLFLATAGDPLAAPDQAVVAGFERMDLIAADPFDEIALGVVPERALIDHAASARLLARGGALLVLGPGPLLAGPEMARGEGLGRVTRVGRSIAAQAASAAWAAAAGLPAQQIILQAPFEVPTGPTVPADAAFLLAEVTVRHMLHPDHGLAVTAPLGTGPDAWRLALPLCLAAGGRADLVIVDARPDRFAPAAAEARTAAALAEILGHALQPVAPHAPLPLNEDVVALTLDLATVALETLDAAVTDGWEPLVAGAPLEGEGAPARLGAAGVVALRDYAGPLVATADRGGG